MNFETNDTHPYKQFIDTSTFETRIEEIENERIETTLIKINSSSSKFQILTLIVFCLYTFFMGVHSFTFMFMYLSPKFFYQDEHGQSKSAFNLTSRCSGDRVSRMR